MHLQTIVTVLCVISGVSGLSLTVISSWAIWVKQSEFCILYPQMEAASSPHGVLNISSTQSLKLWQDSERNWRNGKDTVLIGLCLGCGVLQFFVAIFVLYGWDEDQSNHSSLAIRFMVANLLLLLTLLVTITVMVLTSRQPLTVTIPPHLRTALGLEHFPFITFLQWGLNSFMVWVGFDLIFLLASCVVTLGVVLKGDKLHLDVVVV